MNFQEFKEEVVDALGGSLVDVELSDKDIEKCFKKAKRTFNQKGHSGYRKRFIALNVQKGDRSFDLPASPKVETVVRIIKPPSSAAFSGDPDMNQMLYDQLSPSYGGRIDILTYELSLGLTETLAKYSGHEVDFNHDPFLDKITIFDTPKYTGTWYAESYVHLDDEEYFDIMWIISWATAEAKEMLGIAYRKLSSLPSPTGGDIQLSGSEMVQEAKREKEVLLEEILNFTDGANDYMGISFG